MTSSVTVTYGSSNIIVRINPIPKERNRNALSFDNASPKTLVAQIESYIGLPILNRIREHSGAYELVYGFDKDRLEHVKTAVDEFWGSDGDCLLPLSRRRMNPTTQIGWQN